MNLPLKSEIESELGKRGLAPFVAITMLDYQFNWHHTLTCDYLDLFEAKKIKNLMIFEPPQHGKSELISRRFPAFALGKNPNRRIVGASYSADLSTSFNRDVQRIIDTEEYVNIFPETYLNESNVKTVAHGSYLRNSDIFEIVGKKGSYKSVGIGGSLTGSPCDIGIIDDPIKDAMQAYSQRQRDNVWDWYLNVFKTRLHNDSQILFTMTRWHEDDLAGRILASAKKTGEKWTILNLPAIKEDNLNEDDPRNIGEALWESRHSLKRLLAVQQESNQTFTSLYQQRPSPEAGGIIKKNWFGRFELDQLITKAKNKGERLVWNFTVDGAYTSDTSNAQSAIFCYCIFENEMYVRDVLGVWEEMPEFKQTLYSFSMRNGYSSSSRIYVEPKATGLPIVHTLKRETILNMIIDKSPKDDKVARARSCTPFMEARRVHLLNNGSWVDTFIDQCTAFPNAKLKDKVDCMVMAIQRLNENRGGILTTSSS